MNWGPTQKNRLGSLSFLFHIKEVTVDLALVKWFMMNKISPYNMSKSHFCHSFTPVQCSQIVITPVQNGSQSGLFFKRLKGNNKSITCAEELRAKSGITIYLTSCRFETNHWADFSAPLAKYIFTNKLKAKSQ